MVYYFSVEHHLIIINRGKRLQTCIHSAYNSITSVSRTNEGIPFASHYLIH
jgi:hypothetical protein